MKLVLQVRQYISQNQREAFQRNSPVHFQLVVNARHDQIHITQLFKIVGVYSVFVSKNDNIAFADMIFRDFCHKQFSKTRVHAHIGNRIAGGLFQQRSVDAKCGIAAADDHNFWTFDVFQLFIFPLNDTLVSVFKAGFSTQCAQGDDSYRQTAKEEHQRQFSQQLQRGLIRSLHR